MCAFELGSSGWLQPQATTPSDNLADGSSLSASHPLLISPTSSVPGLVSSPHLSATSPATIVLQAKSNGCAPAASLDSSTPVYRARKVRRVHVERQRVSRACDHCKRKKTRCSGKLPCISCVQLALSCEFTAEYHRGRPPSPEWSGLEISQAQCPSATSSSTAIPAYNSSVIPIGRETNESASQLESPDDRRTCLQPTEMDYTKSSSKENYDEEEGNEDKEDDPEYLQNLRNKLMADQPGGNSPEPQHMDAYGQYVGSASGISFLLRVQKRLQDINITTPSTSILTFGDPILPDSHPSCFILPPKTEAKAMIDFYFSYAMPTYRFLHQPTVNVWFEEFYESFDSIDLKEGTREKNAIIITLFAQARKYPTCSQKMKYKDNSAVYFHAAERQLGIETGRPRLASVQARLVQCFYLLSCSRINHCRSLFGTTAHLIQALGLHRRQRHLSTQNTVDYIEQECRKRVFWAAYNLDKYLSTVLGRPSIFHDNDIDQELPSLVNDEDITHKEMSLGDYKTVNCIMLAPVLHASLVRVLSCILRDLYSIKKVSKVEKISLCRKYTADLKAWRNGLPAFLDPARVQPSLLMTLLQRQSHVLSLAYAHALILVNRPFLLSNFASLMPSKYGYLEPIFDAEGEEAVRECTSAAMLVVDIVDDLNESSQIFAALWFTQYVAFCSVVVLYVYVIRCRSEAPDDMEKYLDAAQKCQRQIAVAAKENSLAQRYSVVLEELRSEAFKELPVVVPKGASRTITEPASVMSQIRACSPADGQRSMSDLSQRKGCIPEIVMPHQPHHARVMDMDDQSANTANSVHPHSAMLRSEHLDVGVVLDGYPNASMQYLTGWENFDNLVMDLVGNGPFDEQIAY
ncbi:fungal-specific transcription factor domain-containing protein [Lipomyces chichibuensis]|uniref:fungal-specific transcription factor domain-containing protein n=1 Tax=Lipomyces chichibuensis TaxID=1546026 RepID=UPI003342E885